MDKASQYQKSIENLSDDQLKQMVDYFKFDISDLYPDCGLNPSPFDCFYYFVNMAFDEMNKNSMSLKDKCIYKTIIKRLKYCDLPDRKLELEKAKKDMGEKYKMLSQELSSRVIEGFVRCIIHKNFFDILDVMEKENGIDYRSIIANEYERRYKMKYEEKKMKYVERCVNYLLTLLLVNDTSMNSASYIIKSAHIHRYAEIPCDKCKKDIQFDYKYSMKIDSFEPSMYLSYTTTYNWSLRSVPIPYHYINASALKFSENMSFSIDSQICPCSMSTEKTGLSFEDDEHDNDDL